MVVRRPYARARKAARQLLWECGVDELRRLDLMMVVGRLKIPIIYGPLDGPTAHIFRNGTRAVIRVSDSIVQIGRRHFTIGHELGHYVLGHRISNDNNAAPPNRTPHQEREADVFSTELLMPEEYVVPYAAMPASLATARAIGDLFQTSIVAAAGRYVELTQAPCALVYSEHGRVVWARHSRSFVGRIPPQIRIGPGTIASDFHANKVLDATAREAPASLWFGKAPIRTNQASLVEHAEVVPEPGWGGVLSLLTHAN